MSLCPGETIAVTAVTWFNHTCTCMQMFFVFTFRDEERGTKTKTPAREEARTGVGD